MDVDIWIDNNHRFIIQPHQMFNANNVVDQVENLQIIALDVAVEVVWWLLLQQSNAIDAQAMVPNLHLIALDVTDVDGQWEWVDSFIIRLVV